MSDNNHRSIGFIVLWIALGLFFAVSGIWTLQGGKGDEATVAITKLFSGDVRNIVRIAFGIIELLAGIFLLLRLFVPVSTTVDTLLMVIIAIVWIVAIVLIDFLGDSGILHNGAHDILSWLKQLSWHLLVLGSVLLVRN